MNINSTRRASTLLLTLLSLPIVKTVLQIIDTVHPTNCNYYFTSLTTMNTQIISIAYDGTSSINLQISNKQSQISSFKLYTIPYYSNPTQVRVWANNSNNCIKHLLYFDKKRIFITSNSTIDFTNALPLNLSTSQTIMDVQFGSNFNQLYLVTKNETDNTYKLSYLFNGVVLSFIPILQVNQTFYRLKYAKCVKYIAIVLSKGMYVFNASILMQLILYNNATGYPTQFWDIDVSNTGIAAFMHQDYIQFYNISNLSTVYNLIKSTSPFPSFLTHVKFISHQQLLVSTVTNLYRYNYTSNTIIQSIRYPQVNKYSIALAYPNTAYLYVQNKQSLSYYVVCLMPSCYVPINQGYLQGVSNQSVRQVSSVLGNSISFCSLKITPTFLAILTNVIDDLWFYKYHRRSNQLSYPSTVSYFLQQADFIGDLKLNPDFMKVFTIFSNSYIAIQENHRIKQYFNFTKQADLDKVYFLNASQDSYKCNITMNILLYFILKLLCFLLYFLKNKWNAFNGIYQVVKNQSQWWFCCVGFFEMNMAKLSFQSGIQLQIPSFVSFFDKINLIIAIIIFYQLLLYSFCFYSLVCTFVKKKSSQILLIRCRFNMISFRFEPFVIIFRNLLRSFVHGYFIFVNNHQLFILFLIDFAYLIIIFRMRYLFKHYIIFYLILCYNLCFLAFDGYFFIESVFDKQKSQFIRQLFGLITISTIFVISILISLFFLFYAIFQIFKIQFEQKISQNQTLYTCENLNKIKPEKIQNDNDNRYQKQTYGKINLIKNKTGFESQISSKKYNGKKQFNKKQILIKNNNKLQLNYLQSINKI